MPGDSPSQEQASSVTEVSEAEDHDATWEFNQPVGDMVRSISLARTLSTVPVNANPFLSSDPRLDPNSKAFDAKKWAQALLHAFSQDPDKFPRHTAGVSFQNLSVHGFGRSTDYQKDVLNVLYHVPLIVADWARSKRNKIQILENFDGLVRSGEMLLVLGRPGSGVTTLLKTIAGHTNGLHVDDKAEFNYQGIPWKAMHHHFRGEIIYQAETDVHFPHLTVGETLLFASVARTPNTRLSGVSRSLYARHLRDVIMAIFGISHTVNTKVGNDFIRGVSGGERKRVSIAEVFLNQSAIQCWDNSTRGLDSATALEFVKTLRLSTSMGGTSAIVALYQASQPSYDEFDKVTVLYEGRQIYFGPTSEAKQYFIDMGYHCPERQTTADFLTSMTNPEERIVQAGFEHRVPRTADEFANHWQMSQTRSELIRDIANFQLHYPISGSELEKLQETRKAHKAPLVSTKSPYTISVPMQVKLCMTRGFQRIRGAKAYFFITIFANLFVGLVLGSIFFNLPDTAESMSKRGAVIFFAILFNGVSSSLEILSLYEQRPVVEKQARYALCQPLSESISSVICDLPSKIFSSLAFNLPLYFMVHLRREADAFFIFLLFSFCTTLAMSSILRTIGQTSKTVHQALAPAAMFILGLVIYTGYVLPVRNMHGWLRWLNYVNPIAYSYESLMANEFSGRKFHCLEMIPSGPQYQSISPLQQTCATAGAAPGQDYVVGDTYIGGTFDYHRSHMWRNFGIILAFVVFFLLSYLAASEYLLLNPSKGEVLVFRGRQGLRQTTDDEESGPQKAPGQERSNDMKSEGGETKAGLQSSTDIFHWQNICYDVDIKGETRRILDNVDGWVRPGTLTALMGASGAGKTTLLDVLADRVTVGVVTGDACVNGYLRGKSFQRKTGYVQQQDIHLETATVREALRFSAELRQPPNTPSEEKEAYVEEVIRLLEMEAYAEAIIGVPGEGLNVEQRKRLTIGVELAGKPELLLFLDEPTSGLDSQTAWSVATLIRKLSNHGQAILCTIHQPSAMLFQQFDRLLLLAKGGQTVYFGPIGKDSRTMIEYFERYGAHSCESLQNPAEWMLSVIGAAPGSHTDRDWFATWRGSPEFEAVQVELKRLSGLKAEKPPIADSDAANTTYAASFQHQLWICLRRVFQQYWRTPSYIYAKLLLCLGNGLLIGLSFQNTSLSLQGLEDQTYSIFMLLVIFAFLLYQTMPNFISQRTLYEGRERASKMYAWYIFMISNLIVEMPWNTVAALVIYFPFYFLVGMYKNGDPTGTDHERGGLMFLFLWAFMIYEGTFAHMAVAAVATAELGAIIALLLFMTTLMFAGVITSYTSLPGFWKFMYRVSPMTYMISGMLSDGVALQNVTCTNIEFLTFEPANNSTCGEYVGAFAQAAGGSLLDPSSTDECLFCPIATTDGFLATMEIYWSDRWRNFGLIWVYIAFNCMAALSMYWLVRVPHTRLGNLAKSLRFKKTQV